MQLPLLIDPQSTRTLQSQIVAQLRELIRDKRLPAGSAVPTTRELSEQLGVSRNTVLGAYESLIGEGYLYTQRAVGTFVSQTLPEHALQVPDGGRETRSGSLHRAMNLPLPYTGRGTTGLHRPTPGDVTVDFVFGRSPARSFPDKTWGKIVGDCLGGASTRMSEYQDPAGSLELRQLVTSALGPWRGMSVSVEQVLMVAGFQQGINLAAHLFVGTNTPVVMEAPTYRGAAFLFESYGGKILPLPVDQHGIDVARLPAGRVKLVYVTPSHQFPTGVTMSLQRRLALLEWAASAGAYLLEVDYDADLRYEGSPLPSLQALDRNGCVIYLNSFSRSIGPALRMGYMVVPRDLVRPAVTIKSLMDNGLPWLEQAALAQFIRNGSLETHLKRLRQTCRSRRDALVAALRRHAPAATVRGADAGTHALVTLPEGLPSADDVQRAARALGVGIYALQDSPAWLVESFPDHARSLLLGYTHLSEAQIDRGIAVLGQVLAS